MFDIFRRWKAKSGAAQGTLVFVGDTPDFAPRVDHFACDGEDPGATPPGGSGCGLEWVRAVGLHDPLLFKSDPDLAELHPLFLEDISNTSEMPKVAEDEEWLFLVVKEIGYRPGNPLDLRHAALAWDGTRLFTFQQEESCCWDSIWQRVKAPESRLRRRGSAAVLAAVLDALIDQGLAAVSQLSLEIQTLEERIPRDQDEALLLDIYEVRREALSLRNMLRINEDMLRKVAHHELVEESSEILPYFQDALEHAVHAAQAAQSLLDLTATMVDVLTSLAGLRMNRVMKLLTVFTAVFIPLTFIAGVYGMNFTNLPGAGWRYGFFLVLGLMLGLGAAMALFFRRIRWL